MSDLEINERDNVRWIALNRPQTRNGLTDELNRQLIAALEEAGARREIRCVVLTGNGGSFSSGLDFRSAMAGTAGPIDPEERLRKYFHGLIRAVRALDKPTIALVDGPAAGFGLDLALACDLRVGTERTRLGEIFVKRGLMPDGGGTFSRPRLIGTARALDLMLTGDFVDADEALRLGLVTRLWPSAEAAERTWSLAARLGAGAPRAQAWIKRAVYGSLDATFDEALETEVRGQMELLRSRDFMEGVSAFFDKRDPRFTGE